MRIELRDIRKIYGEVRANDGIDMTIEPGVIYGLLGENGAGKSTLMKTLAGYHQPDGGEIIIAGQPVQFQSPAQALNMGVGMIYQDPLDVPALRVLENYELGRTNAVRLDTSQARDELLSTAKRLGFEVDPGALIEDLSLGERQQLELVRLLALGAELLILDEPTTGISAEQKAELFQSLRTLAQQEGKSIILVSHKLADVQELCNRVVVLRRGKRVGDAELPCPNETLVGMMFEELPPRKARQSFVQPQVCLRLRDLQVMNDRLALSPLELDVYAGEVLGLAGLEGSGQKLLLQAIAGVLQPESGEIQFYDADCTALDLHAMQARGVAYVPAGRLEEGLVQGLTILEHIALKMPERGFFVDWDAARAQAGQRIAHYRIVGQPESPVEALSGGNQQRTLYALLPDTARVVLLEHPTRGLDVRSADWIWSTLFERAAGGATVIFTSADLDELVERSDRIVAFSGGRMSRQIQASETNADELGHLIGGEL